MKRHRWSTILLTLLLLYASVLPPAAVAQSDIEPDLDVRYSNRATEVFQVKYTDIRDNGDGTLTANLSLESVVAPTYGWTFTIENGQIDSFALGQLALFEVEGVSIPIVGKSTLELGEVTFDSEAELKITMGKWGAFEQKEYMYIFAFNAATFVTLFSGYGYLSTSETDFLSSVAQAALGLVAELGNLGLDLLALAAQLSLQDVMGAFQTIGNVMQDSPELFVAFIQENFSILVSESDVIGAGRILTRGLPVLSTIPLITDLFSKPGEATVTIRTVGLSETVADSVDVVQILDRSGSMDGTPLADAQRAASFFVDLMREGDQVSIVSFASSATVDHALASITELGKVIAQTAIDGIQAGGETSIGAGILEGGRQLTTLGREDNVPAMVLLSDGQENRAPSVDSVLSDIVSAGFQVYTVGLGNGADESLLQRIAAETNAEYVFAPTSGDLSRIYRLISGKTTGAQTVISGQGVAQANQSTVHDTYIDAWEATFALAWNSSENLDLTLVNPAGQRITAADAQGNDQIDFLESDGYKYFRIRGPVTGQWGLQVTGPATVMRSGEADSPVPYDYSVSALTDLKLNAYSDADAVALNDPIRLSAVIYDGSNPITGASVAAVELTSGDLFALRDDGTNGDVLAGDGIFAGVYRNSNEERTYRFGLVAVGDDFSRYDEISVRVSTGIERVVDLWTTVSGPDSVAAGEAVTYSYLYGNAGPSEANDFVVEYSLPDGATFLESSLGVPDSTSTSDLLRWRRDRLGSGATGTLFITIQAPRFAPVGTQLQSQLTLGTTSATDNAVRNNTVQSYSNVTQTSTPPVGAGRTIYLPHVQAAPPCQDNYQPFDVVFSLDRSGSMREDGKFEDARQAMRSFILEMNLDPEQAGLVSFDANVALDQQLTTDLNALLNVLGRLQPGVGTVLGAGIERAAQELMSVRHNPTNTRILIVLTDGRNAGSLDPIDAADSAKANGIRIIAIGLGSDADVEVLQQVASSPDDYYFAPTGADLAEIYISIAGEILCRVE